jgi:hypothetical protein
MNEECLKLTDYFAERDRSGQGFLADAPLDVCDRHALQTSVLCVAWRDSAAARSCRPNGC